MSTKYIKICDCCNNEINPKTESYESMMDNVFDIDSNWEVCENCMTNLKAVIKKEIEEIQKPF